jgi:hypothetical protein
MSVWIYVTLNIVTVYAGGLMWKKIGLGYFLSSAVSIVMWVLGTMVSMAVTFGTGISVLEFWVFAWLISLFIPSLSVVVKTIKRKLS